ncbi:ATP-dependent Clp protease adaptor ClpS [Polluticaenibacter yanchengensis]|uniref:ATP-dependent Clp protease adaptor ClpS n=1 Tax=Polluticaenibacter yanchengensis TaxID=3014562 RepID=A0ABT4UG72_9BACT|nr:ATP-dependent Clp protease adaptor ClpS [Chitinophagaceae bacterium LY-5]
MSFPKPSTNPFEQIDTETLVEEENGYNIILWNDEVNTFEWVIASLVEICGHTEDQAEQCALLVHTKGKYAVKNGSFEKLKPQQEALIDRGINATLEEK